MKTCKSRFVGFLIAVCAFCITAGMGSSQYVQAATTSKATCTIRKIQEKKTYRTSSATYSYQLPQLKGKSSAVKKINQSLKSYYTKDQTTKKNLFREFNTYKKKGTLNKRSLKLFADTRCTVDYNKNGYIRFVYRFGSHKCRSYDLTKTTLIYRLKDGKRVSAIPASETEKKALSMIRGTWYMQDEDISCKVVFSGKKACYYFDDSSEPYWIFTVDKITKTSYGYYFRIDAGMNCYFGYQLRLKDKNSLIRIGNGKPDSSAGYNRDNSLCRSR